MSELFKLSEDKKELLDILDKDIKEFSVPFGVTTICNHAFKDCEQLQVVQIPRSVTKIGKGAFWGSPLPALFHKGGFSRSPARQTSFTGSPSHIPKANPRPTGPATQQVGDRRPTAKRAGEREFHLRGRALQASGGGRAGPLPR